MGGDDLASDDEYFTAPVKSVAEDSDDDASSAEASSAVDGNEDDDNNNDDDDDDDYKKNFGETKKRKRENDTIRKSRTEEKLTSAEKKVKKDGMRGGGPLRVLGWRIREESVESKAEILSQFVQVKFLPQHIARSQNNKEGRSSDSNNFVDRLLSFVSKKQLKKNRPKSKKSPRIIILCLSARRCVAVLKDIAPLRLRVAKLFPKQGSIEDQSKQLETIDFGLAVGTPHRVMQLIDNGSLSLDDTAFVGLDTFENEKSFSVYTLPDTAADTQALLKRHVYPQCSGSAKNGGDFLKVGFL
jgi:protein CMS1